MTSDDSHEEFRAAMKKIPPPISCFSNGAACPWCGVLHRTITFGENNCQSCGQYFCFGYPDWWEGEDPCSFVPFPFKEFYECGEKASMLKDWTPNDVLKALYFQKSEERLGVYADTSTPN